MPQTLLFKKLLFACGFILCSVLKLQAQNLNIVLGRPTDTSITLSLLFDQTEDFYVEYGTALGTYPNHTATLQATAQVPYELDLHALTGNTLYYYRLQHKAASAVNFTPTDDYHFHTQRSPGQPFTFTIEADEHLYDKKGVKSMYEVTLANQAADQPDFMLSLGDIFGDDHYPFTITTGELDTLHRNYRPLLGEVCHSIPFYVCLGNHEGESDYYYNQNPGNNLCVWGTQWRKYYYPNPFPNSFYSGNTNNEPYGIGQPENYYAWTWGDALFVVLDVYRDQCDTSAKPKNWDWTLGYPQYSWLKTTLENSQAKYKFVFAHHIRGQGRGGILEAQLNEWGGLQTLGGANTFAANRPGWAKPIHQLFIDNGVTIFFQGHDHVFAHEQLNGITYQAVPMAADSTYQIGFLANADSYVSDTVDGTGHIRVSVKNDCVQVDYVKAYLPADTVSGIHHNRDIGFTYNVGNCWPTATLTPQAEPSLLVFPNPANEQINWKVSTDNPILKAELLNPLGQCIRVTNQTYFSTTDVNNGLYYIRFSTRQGVVVQKIIIQK